jgi:hypothetical protein
MNGSAELSYSFQGAEDVGDANPELFIHHDRFASGHQFLVD